MVLLTAKEFDLLRWAVDGAEEAHRDDPEEFPAVPEWEDLEYRVREQGPDSAETESQARGLAQVADSLLAKLSR